MNNLLNIKTPAESIAQLRKADYNLSNNGVSNLRLAYWNLATEALYEEAIFRGEGVMSVLHTRTGEPLHDDWILSAALVAVLDQQDLSTHEPALIVHARDPLEDIDEEGF